MITAEEWERKSYQELMQARDEGNWRRFIDLTLTRYEIHGYAFQHFDEVPDSMKYEMAIGAYSHHGDSVPAVRQAVRSLPKYPRPALPEELTKQEAVTVYRAGEEPLQLAQYRLSWTTDKEVALFFLNTWRGRHASHLYQAKIKPKDIIAFVQGREESEVLQYRKVFDIFDIQEIHETP